MNNQNYVVKANKLVEIKGGLGIVEQKILASLISEISPKDEEFETYYINICEIAEVIGLGSKGQYKVIKEAGRNLTKKIIEIEKVNPETGKDKYDAINLLSRFSYEDGSGQVEIEINQHLKPYLLALKGKDTPFTKYMLKNIIKLNSQYAIKLYELLKRYEGNWSISKKYSVEFLREFIGLKEGEYKKFTNFETRVLRIAKKEINEKTDIVISYKKIKNGRRIAEIEFEVYPRDLDNSDEMHKKMEEDKIFDYEGLKQRVRMENENISRKQLAELYEIACKVTDPFEGDPEIYMALTYAYVKIKNPKAFFAYMKKALEQNFINHFEKVDSNEE